jgi:magnesium transporter
MRERSISAPAGFIPVKKPAGDFSNLASPVSRLFCTPMSRGSERRRRAGQNAKRFTEERVRLAREKYGLGDDAKPLPGHMGEHHAEPAGSDDISHIEIGLAPGQLPTSSPFESTGPTKFRVHRFDETSHTVEEFADIDKLPAYADGNKTVWVQVMGITDPQIVHITGAIFQIPMLAQEDVLAVWSRPKVEEHGDMLLAITRSVRLSLDEEGPRGQQISVVAAPGFVISFHENEDKVFAGVEKRIAENNGRMRKWGTGYLLYALLDTLVDRMLYLSEEIEDAITELEDSVLCEGGDCSLHEVYRIKRIVVRLSRIAFPMRDTMGRFAQMEHPLLPDRMDPFLNDLQDHCLRAGDRVEHARMILQDLQEYHHTLQERKTSEIMRMLTVISSIFIPLTFVVGVYGMNFNTEKSPLNMPELNWKYGYPMCLAAMFLFGLGILYYFRRKRWL